jgi:hypothetical protein
VSNDFSSMTKEIGTLPQHLDQLLVELGCQDAVDAYPLSPLQSGVLFHWLDNPDSGVYFIQSVHELDGDLDVPIFTEAWERVVRRHTTLRTTFLWDGLDEPVQIVRAGAPVVLRRLDWSEETDQSDLDSQVEALMAAEREHGFDMARSVPSRLDLISAGDRRHLLVWHAHYLLIDDGGMRLVLDEVLATYAALRTGAEPSVADPIPFRRYVEWRTHLRPHLIWGCDQVSDIVDQR